MSSIEFARNLVKGRIAETIFEQMIRDEGRYSFIPFGYEHTVPTLAQFRNHTLIQKVMDNISDAPDFALVSNDKEKVYLVEVKYRTRLNNNDLREVASKLLKRWNPSWVFVATPNGFFCEPSSSIVEKGSINNLSDSWVNIERQSEYLALLCEFERV